MTRFKDFFIPCPNLNPDLEANPDFDAPLSDGGERDVWWPGSQELFAWLKHPFPEGRLGKGRQVFEGLRDLVLLVLLVGWWVGMKGDMKSWRLLGLFLLPYVLMRRKWCATPYGTRVFGAAPADTAPADTAPADATPTHATPTHATPPTLPLLPPPTEHSPSPLRPSTSESPPPPPPKCRLRSRPSWTGWKPCSLPKRRLPLSHPPSLSGVGFCAIRPPTQPVANPAFQPVDFTPQPVAYPAGQDQRAYDKWIEIEYRDIDSRQSPPKEDNEARGLAKGKIDDHREFSVWATAILPTFVFINSIVVCLVGSAIGFTLLATVIFYGFKPRIFQALAPFEVVRSWNSNFLEATEIPMVTVGGGAGQMPERDERSLSVYGMGKFCFHFIEFFSKIPYVLLNLQRIVSGAVVVVSLAKQCVVVG
ncbi:hypothetical protein L198_07722 [Cryptococcus wingfieldii CBS 7118]|uniref:Uncharacterized protein n=1 Tax=Cryptococcus wingfieldii CBS 7118 TaxID=1295528 RepID=A0A1E3I1K1_9TREE|nr:hypothetical protein L198_07722 [Cryptococcus wingfieldii CBS 7118]ODN82500.1 hypothetical protein L198_07722 [Cryptococcus wingfieldii CBS 7118]